MDVRDSRTSILSSTFAIRVDRRLSGGLWLSRAPPQIGREVEVLVNAGGLVPDEVRQRKLCKQARDAGLRVAGDTGRLRGHH